MHTDNIDRSSETPPGVRRVRLRLFRLLACLATVLTWAPVQAGHFCNSPFPMVLLTYDTNSGECTIFAGLDITATGSLDNLGTLNNPIRLTNYGSLRNLAGGVVSNGGVIQNHGSFDNQGSLQSTGLFTNLGTFSGRLDNQGVFNNVGRIQSTAVQNFASVSNQGAFNNAGDFINQGQFVSNGSFDNVGGFTNMSSLVNGGRATVLGTFLNQIGSVSNLGRLNVFNKFTNLAALHNLPGATFTSQASFVNLPGTATVINEGSFNLQLPDSQLENYATFENRPTGEFDLSLQSSFHNLYSGTLSNQGQLSIQTAAGFVNQGRVDNLTGGRVTNQGNWSNDTPTARLTLKAGSRFTNTGAPARFTNGQYATTQVDTDAQWLNQNNAVLVNENHADFVNAGRVENSATIRNSGRLTNRGTLINNGTLTNNGTLSIDATATLSGTGTLQQYGGTTEVDGELSQAIAIFSAGLLTGNGTVRVGSDLTLYAASAINPGRGRSAGAGDFTGALTIDSNLQFDGGLTFEFAALTDFDQLFVSGNANFGSNSSVLFDFQSFTPAAGDSFDFLFAGSLSSLTNLSYNLLGDIGGLDWNVSATPGNDLRLTFGGTTPVPLPASAWLFAGGLPMLWRAGRPRRQA